MRLKQDFAEDTSNLEKSWVAQPWRIPVEGGALGILSTCIPKVNSVSKGALWFSVWAA